jgi:hypothetical protein
MPNLLIPQMRPIKVKYSDLVLDPNNPRFTTRKEDRITEEHYLEQDLIGHTFGRMFPAANDRYRIDELVNSIKQNSWLPVDYIFVRKLKDDKNRYIVTEGNRRVAAIRKIMNEPEANTLLKASIKTIEVMEVLDSGSPEELQKKITYLLGVRHHGSLKKWTPFAQATNIYNRYIEISGQTTENFEWHSESGQKVADMLSIQRKEVQDRLKVYRVMVQVGNSPDVKNSLGGMEDRYYSLCGEPILSSRKKLGNYISQDHSTFLLNDEGVARMTNLCQFDKKDRGGKVDPAPIHNPQEWRYLDKILSDEDTSKKVENLRLVEQDKKHPSVVWARRAEELTKSTWDKWLFKVNSILKTISLGDDFSTDEAKHTVRRLVALIDQLDERDLYQEVK